MKSTKAIAVLAFILVSEIACGQLSKDYETLVKKADSLYQAKEYKKSAFTFSEAFKANGWKGLPNDRYSAACSWALANYPDSAFFNLNRLADRVNYSNYNQLLRDTDLTSLHKDKRWTLLLEKVKKNREKAEAWLNKPLVQKLDSIFTDDQSYRMKIDELEKKYDWKSKEMQALWDTIRMKDSLNLIKITAILDEYGWLGADVVGEQGNSTLFLVIQHADIKTQEKYLPMMREAVKNGKAYGSSLALLEDRVALRQGKKQIYGSQIGRDPETQEYYVQPLLDPDNVDKRRAEVGLQPLADYVKHWDMKWDVEQYKKDLPAIETKEKAWRKKSE